MSALDNKQLLNLIRYAPVVVVLVFALAVNLIAIKDNRQQAAQSLENLHDELTFQRKDAIRSQVHQVYTQLLLEKSNIERDLKEETKQRVYEAFGIANYIYANNIGKPEDEVKRLIVEALRPLRFFNGRGYFILLANDGKTVMNAANPDLEGQDGWDDQGKAGHDIARDMLNVVKRGGEGFHTWYFKKPGSVDDKVYQKIGYIKKFVPYDWSIATGEYVSDYAIEVKEKLLKWFSNYEYGENGYFFVLDKNGQLLSHHVNDFLGLDLKVGEKVKRDLIEDIQSEIVKGGGYISYSKALTLSGQAELSQVSYVKEVEGWGWVIGTGFSTEAFNRHLRIKEEEFNELNHSSFMRLIYLSIVSMLLLTVSSLYVGNLIARRFNMFQTQINNDFDELNKAKDKMEYMALHDALTGLPNRVLMLKDIKSYIQSAESGKEKFAVLFVDLDNFKNINDLYGHHVGDLLLGVVSQRFKALAEFCGSVSRFGGDEFVFCFTNLKDKAAAEHKAKLVHESLVKPITIDARTLSIGCSVGVSMFPDDSVNAETLISKADTVLYKSKSDKKGQVLFYSSHISAQIKRKMNIQHELTRAIEKGELSVNYQPQISTRSKKMVSVEALVRWKNASLGSVFPDEFIPIAEETGLINSLGLFVFRRACEDIYALSPNGKDALQVSINISPVQLMEPDFYRSLVEINTEIGIDPKRISLEITENIFINGFDAVKPILSELREYGFGLSLDDFGTGYSSLSYINSLPLSEIKIDRSFVNKFLDFYQSDMLVRMIISIGRLCGLLVVAEGVETEKEFNKLVSYGCDLIQGYYFDKPLSLEILSERYFSSHPEYDKGITGVSDI